MHRINKLFQEVINELWAVKRCTTKIELVDLIDLYKEYQYFSNLVVDAINSQVIQYTDLNIKLKEDNVSAMIDAFEIYNKYNYNRLVIDSLCEVNSKPAYQYLNKILSNKKNKAKFIRDFSKRYFFEQTKKELKELGNNL